MVEKDELKEMVEKLLGKYVTKTKRVILELLFEEDRTINITELSRIIGASQPLIAFHLNGNINNIDSLCFYKLVKRVNNRRNILLGYQITQTGKTLMRFLKEKEES